MSLVKILVCLILISLVHAVTIKNLSKSLIDFVQYKNKPTKMNLLVSCWKQNELNTLVKTLSDNNLQSNSINLERKSEKLETNFKQTEMFVVDFNCYNSTQLFSSDYLDFLQYPYRWFIFINNIQDLPNNLPLYVNTRIYLLQKQSPNILVSPYLINTTSDYNFMTISNWSTTANEYISPIIEIRDYVHRANQNGLIVHAAGVMFHNRTFKHFDDFRYLTEDSYTKHNYYLFRHLMDILNTTAEITWHRGWGTFDRNTSKYNLLLGAAQHGKAEFLLTVLFVGADRLAFLDIISDPMPTAARFVYKAPVLSSIHNILTMSFDGHCWAALGALLVLMYMVILIIVKLEWKFLDNTEAYDAKVLQADAMAVLQFQIGTVSQQGIESEPRSVSGRIITFVALLSLLFFYTAYSACIVALLQSTSDSINDLSGLLYSKIELASDAMPYSKLYLATGKGKIKQGIYNQKIAPPNKPPNFIPLEVGVERMRTEFFAYHSEVDSIYKLISKTYMEHEKCGLMEVGFIDQMAPYIHSRKRSAFRKIVMMTYSKFKEYGLARRVLLRTYAGKPKCTQGGANFRSVGLFDAYFAVLCYSIGLGFSIFIYAIEQIIRKLKIKFKN